ncbi:hypothetical protein LCGC14_2258030 [marine sediment metagenome]|uniref:Polymerase/histidinol phosphatase N-terminal domain-containing protein n=1 Tax=marine sediment metagenome TaxID=412755 RepID=A0A0F9FD10_9ZZZZ
MKVELHLHTARYSYCARPTPARFVEQLIRLGYEAVYITEHDAVWDDWEIDQLRQGYPDIRIFPGVELTITRDPIQHLLVLGTMDRAFLSMDGPAEVLAEARRRGHLTVLAHPFRWEGASEMLESGVLPDALELRSVNQGPQGASLAQAAAERYGMPLVNCGDSHDLDFLDRFWIETDRPLRRVDDIRSAVLNRAYVNCTGDNS